MAAKKLVKKKPKKPVKRAAKKAARKAAPSGRTNRSRPYPRRPTRVAGGLAGEGLAGDEDWPYPTKAEDE
jgi:hypothetical protein